MDKARESRKLPIGIQNFETIRREGYLYVDKTEYIYKLLQNGMPYFLSRPRRFGKSLFLSTLKAYFEGKRELFEGLAIEELTKDDPDAFAEYPVFYFDFNGFNYKEPDAMETVLNEHLSTWEAVYGNEYRENSSGYRFEMLLKKAKEKTGRSCVVLVDEYDKGLLESDSEQDERNRAIFKGFFGKLKSCDAYLKLVFITGVTKFSKVSIFSDLNQLQDISMNENYSGICGITQKELLDTFALEIEEVAERRKMTSGECLKNLKKMYDGYHFSEECEGIYNPFSLLNAFADKKFGSYWFETGTPTFLINKLKTIDFDPKTLSTGEICMGEDEILDYRSENPNPVPLLYQTGYLTIKGYDKELLSYELSYPNDEVKFGFVKSIAPFYLHAEKEVNPLDIRSFTKDLKNGDAEGIKKRFTVLFARIPYPEDEKYVERDFQNVIYLVFTLMGQFVMSEVHNAKGRADAVVETSDYIYLFEFKRDKTAEEALAQIEENGYAKPYAADPRKLIKIGVNFSTKDRNIDGWIVES